MRSLSRYARHIEQRWNDLLARPKLLGEKDWEWIHDWHQREIPTTLIDEAFDELAEKLKRRKRPPNNLGVLAPLVEESWRAVREGRMEPAEEERPPSAPPAPPSDPAEESTLQLWRKLAKSLPTNSDVRGLLQELCDEMEAGLPESEAAIQLDQRLPSQLPEQLRIEIESEIGRQLEPFKSRMDPETWRQTYHRALARAARQSQGIPVR